MRSKTRLFKDLARELGDPTYIDLGLKHPAISDETYGKMSCVYVYLADDKEARTIGKHLKDLGHKINEYGIASVLEIHTSYFKGFQWND